MHGSTMSITTTATRSTRRHVRAGIGSTAEAVRKNVLHNVGEGLSHGRKGAQVWSQSGILSQLCTRDNVNLAKYLLLYSSVRNWAAQRKLQAPCCSHLLPFISGSFVSMQGVLDRVQEQLQEQRLMRALSQRRGQTIDIQIGFNVYLDVPQEMRSRLWLVILTEPSLAVPFQVCCPVVKSACTMKADMLAVQTIDSLFYLPCLRWILSLVCSQFDKLAFPHPGTWSIS